MDTYDPEALGARCSECILRGSPVVPPEGHIGASVAIVGEAPGADEEVEGRPFVGPSGIELQRTLERVGVKRAQVYLSNACLCRPPSNKLEVAEQQARTRGLLDPITACAPRLHRELAGFERIIPVGGRAANALVPGRPTGILQRRGSLIEVPETLHPEGYTSAARRIVPTVHPAFVLRAPRFRPVFSQDLGRAFRWFRGALDWHDPALLYRPTPEQLVEWLQVPAQFWSWDLETEWNEGENDPLLCKIRCIGIADNMGGRAVVVPFVSIDGRFRFYDDATEQLMVRIIGKFLTSGKFRKIGWNTGGFDWLVVEARWGFTWTPEANDYDGILAHRNIEPEMPHNLAFVGSVYTDVPAWKTDSEGSKLATGARSDEDLWLYCGRDCAVTSRAVKPIFIELAKRGSSNVFELDHRIQEVCRGLHKVGMPLDVEQSKPRFRYEPQGKDKLGNYKPAKKIPLNAPAWDRKLTDDAVKWLGKARVALGKDTVAARAAHAAALATLGLGGAPAAFTFQADGAADWMDDDPLGALEGRYSGENAEGAEAMDAQDVFAQAGADSKDPVALFNPGSPHQIRSILFDQWGLTPPSTLSKNVAYTSNGEPSTGDAVIVAMLCDTGLPELRRDFLLALRGYRKAIKLRGTYVRPAMRAFEEGGVRWKDGRVRASWNAHTTSPGRLSSSRPNLQNVKAKLRTMYRAHPGRVMGGADASQIHLRIIASRWQVARLQECFARDGDPHAEAALAAFGERFINAPGWPAGSDPRRGIVGKGGKWSGLAKEMRQTAKILQYAAAYGADAPTVHRVLLSTENDDGELINLKVFGGPDGLAEVRLLHANWLKGMPEFQTGWDKELNHWRQHGYIEEPVTGRRCWFSDGEDFNAIVNWPILASEAAIMHLATLRLVREMPFGKWGPGTGLINQCHDSLTAETLLLRGHADPFKLAREVSELTAWAIAQPVKAYSDVPFLADPVFGPTWADA